MKNNQRHKDNSQNHSVRVGVGADSPIPRCLISGYYGSHPDVLVNLFLTDVSRLSNGTFGVVYCANLFVYAIGNKKKEITQQGEISRKTPQVPEFVAVKKVLQDKRFKNRELQIMRQIDHVNIIKLKYFFKMIENDELYLGLIMEYLPKTLNQFVKSKYDSDQGIDVSDVKIIGSQLFQGLSYLHDMDVCHRDIKPHNILIRPNTLELKICDFGSAKVLAAGEQHVAYICSRHYRAPELILGLTTYDTKIDVWSAGCVFAELLTGRVLFMGDDSTGQLSEIVKVLGAPGLQDQKEIQKYRPNFVMPSMSPSKTLSLIIPDHKWAPFLKILKDVFVYSPSKRISSRDVLSKIESINVN